MDENKEIENKEKILLIIFLQVRMWMENLIRWRIWIQMAMYLTTQGL